MLTAMWRLWWIYCTSRKSFWLCRRWMFPRMNDIFSWKVTIGLRWFILAWSLFCFRSRAKQISIGSRRTGNDVDIASYSILRQATDPWCKEKAARVSVVTEWLFTFSCSFFLWTCRSLLLPTSDYFLLFSTIFSFVDLNRCLLFLIYQL